jgi:hypothetical protein
MYVIAAKLNRKKGKNNMKIKEISIGRMFKEKRVHNPSEIMAIMDKVNNCFKKGKGLRIEEKNKKVRSKLYWRIYSHIYINKLPMKVKSVNGVIGVWRTK